jgi:hypothetical protein
MPCPSRRASSAALLLGLLVALASPAPGQDPTPACVLMPNTYHGEAAEN